MTQQQTIAHANALREGIDLVTLYNTPREKRELIEMFARISSEVTLLGNVCALNKNNALTMINFFAVDGLTAFAKGKSVKYVATHCKQQQPNLIRWLDELMAANGYESREEFEHAGFRYYPAEAKAA